MSKIYAIGFKNWVELRAYKNPPVPEIDEVSGTTEEVQLTYDFNGRPTKNKVKVPWKIKTVHYPRGKVIYTLKSSKLKYLGVYVGDQACKELGKTELTILASRPEFGKLKAYL